MATPPVDWGCAALASSDNEAGAPPPISLAPRQGVGEGWQLLVSRRPGAVSKSSWWSRRNAGNLEKQMENGERMNGTVLSDLKYVG